MTTSKSRYQKAKILQLAIDSGAEGIEIKEEDYYTFVDEKWLDQHGYGSRVTRWRKRIAGKFPQPVSKMGTAA